MTHVARAVARLHAIAATPRSTPAALVDAYRAARKRDGVTDVFRLHWLFVVLARLAAGTSSPASVRTLLAALHAAAPLVVATDADEDVAALGAVAVAALASIARVAADAVLVIMDTVELPFYALRERVPALRNEWLLYVLRAPVSMHERRRLARAVHARFADARLPDDVAVGDVDACYAELTTDVHTLDARYASAPATYFTRLGAFALAAGWRPSVCRRIATLARRRECTNSNERR